MDEPRLTARTAVGTALRVLPPTHPAVPALREAYIKLGGVPPEPAREAGDPLGR